MTILHFTKQTQGSAPSTRGEWQTAADADDTKMQTPPHALETGEICFDETCGSSE